MEGCVRAHLRRYPEDLLRTSVANDEDIAIEALHRNQLEKADHHLIRGHQQLKICSAAEKEPQVIPESVLQMEGHLVALAYSDQETIQAASDMAVIPIVANQRLAQILGDLSAHHLATQGLTDQVETPAVANHRVTPVFNDLQDVLLPAQIFNGPVEAPIAESRLVAPVFKDLLAGRVVLPPDHQEVPIRADHQVAPAQGNQAVQTVEEDIDLPLFFAICIRTEYPYFRYPGISVALLSTYEN
jgi:hypothetical protein